MCSTGSIFGLSGIIAFAGDIMEKNIKLFIESNMKSDMPII